MKLYKLYWSWYEDHSYWLFSHIFKTKEEFEADVKTCLIEAEKIGDASSYLTMEDMLGMVAQKLPELGYQVVEPEVEYGFWGGYIIDGRDVPHSGDDCTDTHGKKLPDIMGKEFMDSLIAKNSQRNDDLHKGVS